MSTQPVPRHVARGIDGILQRLPRTEHLALNEVDVEVAVVVVVEEADAGRHDLGIIDLTRHPVEVDEVEPGLPGPFDEPFSRCLWSGCRGRRPVVARSAAARDGHEHPDGHSRRGEWSLHEQLSVQKKTATSKADLKVGLYDAREVCDAPLEDVEADLQVRLQGSGRPATIRGDAEHQRNRSPRFRSPRFRSALPTTDH
jgi:hypothetical protein